MSTWIYITNLPLLYSRRLLLSIFTGIGKIKTTKLSKQKKMCTAIVQFTHSKHAKLAASKKDHALIDPTHTIRVFIIWCNKEDLSSIKVTNIVSDSSVKDLETYFNPFGDIVNIEVINECALISFSKVEYALQASQEMNNTIIDSGHQLSVTLLNPDARNLQWKRHSFEFIAVNNKKKRKKVASQTSKKPIRTDELSMDKIIEFCEMIVYGFVRENIPSNVTTKISETTLYYFNYEKMRETISNITPLYLRDPSIPPPPLRPPPSPPVPAVVCAKSVSLKSVSECADSDMAELAELNSANAKTKTEKTDLNGSGLSIEGKYQQIFDIYRDRLEMIETKMGILRTDYENVSVTMNRTLVGLEQRRVNDINTIQKQFNSTITALCYQINNQINNQIIKMTQKMEQSKSEHNGKLDELELKILKLKRENDVLRKQNKINKILKIQNNNKALEIVSEEEKLKNWLFDVVKLPQYLPLLVCNGYDDLESINDITFDELQTVGITKMGHRKKIIKYANKLYLRNNTAHVQTNTVRSNKYVIPSEQQRSAMSPNSANSSLLYSHNIWSDDSVSSVPWNTTNKTPQQID